MFIAFILTWYMLGFVSMALGDYLFDEHFDLASATIAWLGPFIFLFLVVIGLMTIRHEVTEHRDCDW